MPLSPIPGASLKDTLTGTVAASTSHTPDSGGGAYAATGGSAANILIGNGGAYSILTGSTTASVESTLTTPISGDFLWQGLIQVDAFSTSLPFARPVVMDSSGNFYCINAKANGTTGLYMITSGAVATLLGTAVTTVPGTTYLATINRVGTTVTASLGGLANMTGTDSAPVVGSSINRVGFMYAGASTGVLGPYSIGTNAAATSYNVYISGGNLVSGVASIVQFQANGLPSSGIVVTPTMGVAGTWSGLTTGTITLSDQFVHSATFTPSAVLSTNTLTCTSTGGGGSITNPSAFAIPAVAAIVKPSYERYKPAAALAPTYPSSGIYGAGVLVGVCETNATPVESIRESTIPFVAGTGTAGTTTPTATTTTFGTGNQGLLFISTDKELQPAYPVPVSTAWTQWCTITPTSVTTSAIPISLGNGGPGIMYSSSVLGLYMNSTVNAFSPPITLNNSSTYTIVFTYNGTVVTAYIALWTGSTYSLQTTSITLTSATSASAHISLNNRSQAGWNFIGTYNSAGYADGVTFTAANVATLLQDIYATIRGAGGSLVAPYVRVTPTLTGFTLSADGVAVGSVPTQGGTGALTYQYLESGPNLPTGTFTNLTGATSRNSTITGRTRRTETYIQLKVTDSTAATVTTTAYPVATRPPINWGIVFYGDSYAALDDLTTMANCIKAAAAQSGVIASVTIYRSGWSGFTSQSLMPADVSAAYTTMAAGANTALASCDEILFCYHETINDAKATVTSSNHSSHVSTTINAAIVAGALVTGKTARALILEAVPLRTEDGHNVDADNAFIEQYRTADRALANGTTIFMASTAVWQQMGNKPNDFRATDGVHLTDSSNAGPTGSIVGFSERATLNAMEVAHIMVADTIGTGSSGVTYYSRGIKTGGAV